MTFTKSDVADELRVSVRTVSRLIASGELAAFRVGRQVRVRDVDLRRFVAERVDARVTSVSRAKGRHGSATVSTPIRGRLWE